MSSARDRIFGQMHRALEQGRKEGWLASEIEDVLIDEELVRELGGSGEDIWEKFVDCIENLGDRAIRVGDWEEAGKCIERLADERNWGSGILDQDVAERLGIESSTSGRFRPAGERDVAFKSDFGITFADCAVAETGSLIICVGPGRSRLTSLVPTVHIALLPIENLVADVLDGLRFQQDLEDNTFTWITGSSRTADIDGILIRGAHGPEELIVIGIG